MKAIILMCAFLFSQQKPLETGVLWRSVGSVSITAPMAEQRKVWLAEKLKEEKQGTKFKICEDICEEHYAVLDAATGKWELHGMTYDEVINDLIITVWH